MMGLLLVRDKIKNFFGEHEFICMAAVKFLLVLVGMLLIKQNIGFMPSLQKISVIFIISLLSAFLPMGLAILILALVILANIYSLSLALSLVLMGVLLVMFIVYYRFTPKESILLVIIPMLFYLKLPYLVPLVIGLLGTPVSIVTGACGTIVYYMIHLISSNSTNINNMDENSITEQVKYYIDLLIAKNTEMVVTIAIFTVIVICVYIIKRMSINNSWTVAIVAGGTLELILFIVSSLVFDFADIDNPVIIVIECAISVVLAIGLQFFVFSVDYSRIEHTQFEDDDYYYYVKAVPKINVVAPEMNIKRINAQRQSRNKK